MKTWANSSSVPLNPPAYCLFVGLLTERSLGLKREYVTVVRRSLDFLFEER